jgi:hypothetical protein
MSVNSKIFTTVAILESDQLAAAGASDVQVFTRSERTRLINRYWANIDGDLNKRRRVFPIEYWELDTLFSTANQVGVHVHNIDDPGKVTVEWKPFDPDQPPVLAENSRCFVLSKNYYDGSIAILDIDEASYEIRGLARFRQPKPATVFICVLLGQEADGRYCVFIQNARANLLNKNMDGGIDTAPGGEGTGGAKIPR